MVFWACVWLLIDADGTLPGKIRGDFIGKWHLLLMLKYMRPHPPNQVKRRNGEENFRGDNSMCKGTGAWKSVFLRLEISSLNTMHLLVSGWLLSRPMVLSPTWILESSEVPKIMTQSSSLDLNLISLGGDSEHLCIWKVLQIILIYSQSIDWSLHLHGLSLSQLMDKCISEKLWPTF